MINIDFKAYFRDRVWFTWQCLNILHDVDGKPNATWQATLFPANYFKWPFIYRHGFEIEEYFLKEDNAGCQVYTLKDD